MIADGKNYTTSAAAVVSDLRAQGMTVNDKNTWNEGVDYKGLNLSIVDPEGNRFELQIHTPESSRVAAINHEIYANARGLDKSSDEFKTQYAQMVANADTLTHPDNVESLGSTRRNMIFDGVLIRYNEIEGGVTS